MADRVVVVKPDERVEEGTTPGMVREEAFSRPGLWAGVVRTESNASSGWHHHGGHDTAAFVLSGTVKVESGPGGRDVVDAGAGDFLLIPKRLVHRESTPGGESATVVAVRAGTGEVVVNVEGPESDG
jgi:uncharacterized RmlC-like cupin family protein